MATRFINPINTPYESQFVPLPIDYMAKSLDAKQKAFDNASAKMAESAITLKETPWTVGTATQYAKKYNQELEDITSDLMTSGNVNQAMMRLSSTNKRFINDPIAQKYQRDAEFYEKQIAPLVGKEGWNSVYIPGYQDASGNWTNIDYANPANASLLSKSPTPIFDNTTEYLQKGMYNHFKGIAEAEQGATNFTMNPDGTFSYINSQNERKTINPLDPKDEFTRRALDSWSDRIANPQTGTDPQEIYIREKIAKGDPNAIRDFIYNKSTPFWNRATSVSNLPVFGNDGSGRAGKEKTSDVPMVDIDTYSDEALESQGLGGFDTRINNLHQNALQNEMTAVTSLVDYSTNIDKSNMANLKSQLQQVDPSIFKKVFGDNGNITTSNINEYMRQLKANPGPLQRIDYRDDNGKVIKTNYENSYDYAVRIMKENALSQFENVYAMPQGADRSRRMLGLTSVFNSIATAEVSRENATTLLGIREGVESDAKENFVNNFETITKEQRGIFSYLDDTPNIIKTLGSIANPIASGGLGLTEYFGINMSSKEINKVKDKKSLIQFALDNDNELIDLYDKLSYQARPDVMSTPPKTFMPNEKDLDKRSNLWTDKVKKDLEIIRPFGQIAKAYNEYRQDFKDFKLEDGEYLFPLSTNEKNTTNTYFKGWTNNMKDKSQADLLREVIGDTYDIKNGLGDLFDPEKNPNNLKSMDPDFDPEKISGQNIDNVGLDLNASDGPHFLVTFKQKLGSGEDAKSATARLRVPINTSNSNSLYQNVVFPMMENPDPKISQAGFSTFFQMNIDNFERGLVKTLASTNFDNQKGTSVPVKFDIGVGGDPVIYNIFKNKNGTVITNTNTGEEKTVNGSSYADIIDVMSAMYKRQFKNQFSAPASSGGASSGKSLWE